MIIAKAGDFSLRTETFVVEHVYTTHDIEICKDNYDGTCYTVATFNDDGEIVSCMDRLLTVMMTDTNAVHDIQQLARIGNLIVNLDKVESGFKVNK